MALPESAGPSCGPTQHSMPPPPGLICLAGRDRVSAARRPRDELPRQEAGLDGVLRGAVATWAAAEEKKQ